MLRSRQPARSGGERGLRRRIALLTVPGAHTGDGAPSLQVLHRLPLRGGNYRRGSARSGDLRGSLPVNAARKRIVVVGGGIGGLAAAALLGRAGHKVTLVESNDYLGGKSKRITLDGQRIDTGPAIVTFPGVWEEFLRRWNTLDERVGGDAAQEISGFELKRLPEVGRYYYRGEEISLPVEKEHPWHEAWERFVGEHGGLGPEVTRLLTTDWHEPRLRPALLRLLRLYGARLT